MKVKAPCFGRHEATSKQEVIEIIHENKENKGEDKASTAGIETLIGVLKACDVPP